MAAYGVYFQTLFNSHTKISCQSLRSFDDRWIHKSHMMTLSNGSIFRVTGPLWGESTGDRWIPLSKASDAGLWCVFYLRLSKQPRRRWFERPSSLLWRHCNAAIHPLSQPGGIRGTVQLKTRISHSTTCKLMLSLVVPSSHYLSGTITNTTIMLLDPFH